MNKGLGYTIIGFFIALAAIASISAVFYMMLKKHRCDCDCMDDPDCDCYDGCCDDDCDCGCMDECIDDDCDCSSIYDTVSPVDGASVDDDFGTGFDAEGEVK